MLAGKWDGKAGNEMFMYAGSYSIAKANGLPLYFYDHNNIKEVFHITSKFVSRSDIEQFNGTKKFSQIGESCGFDRTMFDISHDTDTLIMAYMWSWLYFEDYDDDIQREFTFKPEILEEAAAKLKSKTKNIVLGNGVSASLVGVHIRRGDTLNPGIQQLGRIQPPLTYYYNAMDYYKQKFGEHTIFVYCSDDMDWVEDNFKNVTDRYNMVFMDSGNSWAVDMAILTQCDHSIISTGTYGWWAAYLTCGTVVHYKHVAREGSGIRRQFSQDLQDYLYPGWISME